MNELQFPADLLYTRDHEWVRVNGNLAFIGITAFAASELGDIVYLDVPGTGKIFAKNDVFGTVEAVKTVSDLFMPVEGRLLECNSLLTGSPELVNGDPYWDGWIIKVEMYAREQLQELLSPAEYLDIIGY